MKVSSTPPSGHVAIVASRMSSAWPVSTSVKWARRAWESRQATSIFQWPGSSRGVTATRTVPGRGNGSISVDCLASSSELFEST